MKITTVNVILTTAFMVGAAAGVRGQQPPSPDLLEDVRSPTGVDVGAMLADDPQPRTLRIEGLRHEHLDFTRPIAPLGAAAPLLRRLDGVAVQDVIVDPQVLRVDAVEIDFAAIITLNPGQSHRLQLPRADAAPLELVLLETDHRGPDDVTWVGQVAGVASSLVILVRYRDALHLVVRNYQPGGRFYEVHRSRFDDHIMITRTRYSSGACGVGQGPDLLQAEVAGAGGAEAPLGGVAMAGAVDDPSDVIDVMIVPSNQAKAGYGSEAAFVAACGAMIADLNTRVANSVGSQAWTYRLCAAPWSLIDYDESGDYTTDVQRLRYVAGEWIDNNVNGQQDPGEEVDPAGAMDIIQETRNDYRPDLVHLIVEQADGNGIGIAYILDNFNGFIGAGYGLSMRAHAVDGTFAHEIGHNMGLCHNVEESATCAIANAGHGIARFCDHGNPFYDEEEYRTTMSYVVCSGCPSIQWPVFSSVGIVVVVEDPFGFDLCSLEMWQSGQAVAAAVANESRHAIADYNIASSQMWVGPGSDGVGTWQFPFNMVRHGVNNVQGGASEAVVRVRSGTYGETASAGGAVTLSNPCTIVSEDGAVTIQ